MNQKATLFLAGILALSLGVGGSALTWAVEPGAVAPDFSGKNQNGQMVSLNQFKGKPVLLYFYPKDDTPGCTKQACRLRDDYSKYQKLGVVILGISRQGTESKQAFHAKYKLPFDLIADEKGEIADKYGVGSMAVVGKILGMSKRESFLVDARGNLFRHYKDVDPEHHSEMILKDLLELKGSPQL